MTDAAIAAPIDWASEAATTRRKRRHAKNRRLQILGIGAISTAIALLFVLVASLVVSGYQGFSETRVTIPVELSSEDIDPADIRAASWRSILRDSVAAFFPDAEGATLRALQSIPTDNAQFILRDAVLANPSLIGTTYELQVPVSDPFDQLAKGGIDRDLPANLRPRGLSDEAIGYFDALDERGRIDSGVNWDLLTRPDSRFPELAGLLGAIVGSAYALLVCFLISFPVGIAAAVYLEEFAPRNRITDFIEVNINNLAAVPSIVFGLLGLAVFLGWFGLPRSAPLVGGMVLSLMTLPTIIIVTRASLKSVPPSIREAALGMGASKHEVMLHHVLPLALPGILTGTIIGLAQALGETAPLLLIGMNAFITSPPEGILSPATALPTQIFIWADSPERGFRALTSAGILVLLAFLVIMNGLAIFLRQRLERTW